MFAQYDDNDDDEVVLVGSSCSTYDELPHLRFDCTRHHWDHRELASAILTCPSCYCYLCDRPVSACISWTEHCFAKRSDSKWKSAIQAQLRLQEGKEPLIKKKKTMLDFASVIKDGSDGAKSGAFKPLIAFTGKNMSDLIYDFFSLTSNQKSYIN